MKLTKLALIKKLMLGLACGMLLPIASGESAILPYRLRVEHARSPLALDLSPTSYASHDLPVRPRFSWAVKTAEDAPRGTSQTAYRVVVWSARNGTVVADSDIVEGARGSATEATPLLLHAETDADTDFVWNVTVWANNVSVQEPGSGASSATAHFGTGLVDWADAQWIGAPGRAGNLVRSPEFNLSLAYNSSGGVSGSSRGRVYIACPGFCRTYVNGKPAFEAVLGQQTTYEASVLYDSADITALLHPGPGNVVAVELGAGWYGIQEAKMQGAAGALGNRSVRLVLTASAPSAAAGATSGAVEHLRVGSSTAWLQRQGPVVVDGVYAGEVYDARLEVPGWNEAFASTAPARPAGWVPAQAVAAPPGALKSTSTMPRIARVGGALDPVGPPQPLPDIVVGQGPDAIRIVRYLYRFERNVAGWVAVVVAPQPASAGSCRGCNITLVHSELYGAPGGGVPQFQYSRAHMVQTFLLKGNSSAEERLEPRFSSYGFQFVELQMSLPPAGETSATLSLSPMTKPAQVLPDVRTLALRAYEIHSDVETVGSVGFNGGGDKATLLAKVQRCTVSSALANLNSVPTDCPTRERRGYLGDSQLASSTMVANFDMHGAYRKFLGDIRDAQWQLNQTDKHSSTPPGPPSPGLIGNGDALGCKAPWYRSGGYSCDPTWQIGYAVIAQRVLSEYGDTRLAREHWPALLRYAQLASSQIDEHGLWTSASGSFGDWNPSTYPPRGKVDSHAPSDLLNTFQYAILCRAMAELGAAAGEEKASAAFSEAAAATAEAMHARYFNVTGDGSYYDNATWTRGNITPSQTQQALPLALAVMMDEDDYPAAWTMPAADRAAVVDALLRKVQSADHHIVAGIVGTKYILPALADHGHMHAAMTLLHQTTQPSWGFWVKQGATTLWESFSSTNLTGDVGSSRNHIMFGTQGAFYFSHVAGLRRAAPAWRAFRVAPQVCGTGLQGANASLQTVAGHIATSWQTRSTPKAGASATVVSITVDVPPGVVASVIVPLGCGDSTSGVAVAEGGAVVWRARSGLVPHAGIVSASQVQSGAAVEFEVRSGGYAFEAYPDSNIL